MLSVAAKAKIKTQIKDLQAEMSIIEKEIAEYSESHEGEELQATQEQADERISEIGDQIHELLEKLGSTEIPSNKKEKFEKTPKQPKKEKEPKVPKEKKISKEPQSPKEKVRVAQDVPREGSKSAEILERLKKGQKPGEIQKEMKVYYSQVQTVMKRYLPESLNQEKADE